MKRIGKQSSALAIVLWTTFGQYRYIFDANQKIYTGRHSSLDFFNFEMSSHIFDRCKMTYSLWELEICMCQLSLFYQKYEFRILVIPIHSWDCCRLFSSSHWTQIICSETKLCTILEIKMAIKHDIYWPASNFPSNPLCHISETSTLFVLAVLDISIIIVLRGVQQVKDH